MQSNNNKNSENRRGSDRKPAGAGSLNSGSRNSRERARAHHGLLKGPFYPLVGNLPSARAAA
jgi:hypothetical protein